VYPLKRRSFGAKIDELEQMSLPSRSLLLKLAVFASKLAFFGSLGGWCEVDCKIGAW
jgi:hypothetical protein